MPLAFRTVAAVFLVAAYSICGGNAFGQARVALVIGNNAYTQIAPLNNAVNDAAVISEELRKNGFQVIRVIDAKSAEIETAKKRFIAAIANGGIGVFYFSGHGLQVEGRNYLLPVDFSSGSEAALGKDSLSVPALLDDLEAAKPRLSIVILDACRDNPFAKDSAQVVTRGLSEVARPVPAGTLVLYSASSNQTALDAIPDQRSRHGLFTGELLAAMQQGGLEIRELAQKVRYSVMEKAEQIGHLQVPALYDNLSSGAFYLTSRPATARGTAGARLPQRIKIVIPFAAQGPSDAVVRTIAPFLSNVLKREVVVENQIDVQGDSVTELVANGPKDGSLLMISPFAASARRLQARDQRTVPIGILVDTPLSIVANNDSGAQNLPQLLNAARRTRKRLRVAVPLKGSPAEMCGQQLRAKLGANVIELVPVAGEGPAVAEVSKGRADLACASTAAVRSLATNPNLRLRELAEIRSTASPLLRKMQVDAAGSQGFDLVAPNWLGLYGPAGLPREVVNELTVALATLQSDPVFIEALARRHALPMSPDQSTPQGLIQSLRLAIALQR